MLEFENSFTLPTPPPHRFYESQNPAQGQQIPCNVGRLRDCRAQGRADTRWTADVRVWRASAKI